MRKILIVDDEDSVRYSFRKLFREPEYLVVGADSGPEGITLFAKEKPDLVVLDIELPGMNGLEVIQRIKGMAPHIPVLIITAYGTSERVIAAMKYGAYEYLEKPFDVPRLKAVIEEALETTRFGGMEITADPQDKEGFKSDRIVGNSSAIKEVYKMIGRVAASDVSVLLVGESGTGKELVARAIFQNSSRADKPFLTINCAAIPDTLLESELFGHEKGSFTDASKAKAGKFELAGDGTLFLDEIGDMSLSTQAKLLRVLQEGTFERLGGTKTIKVNVRIIAATNKNLENAIASKNFREDLYYRLKVITITLPPLRIRKEDIPLLTHYFISKHEQLMNVPAVTIPPETIQKLMDYNWPGNVRELENVLKRAVLLSKTKVLTPDLITEDLSAPKPLKSDQPGTRISGIISVNLNEFESKLYKHVIEEVEKGLLKISLDRMNGNQVKTARLLGISRVMLRERMDKYNIQANPGARDDRSKQ
jgi:DNA-binding NtrC family response regulator